MVFNEFSKVFELSYRLKISQVPYYKLCVGFLIDMSVHTSSSLQATLQRPHRPFKDLDQLARLGQVRRHHGGISNRSSSQNIGPN